MMEDGVPFDQVFDKVVAPALASHQESIMSRGYGAETQTKALNEWKVDSSAISTREVYKTERLVINDYADRISRNAEELIRGGDVKQADSVFKNLAGLVGSAKAGAARDGAYYNVANRASADAKLKFSQGGTAKDYFQTLSDLRTEMESADFSGADALYNNFTFQMANVAGQLAKESVKFEKDLYEAVRDGKYDPEESQLRAERLYGDEVGKNRFTALQNTMTKGAATDKNHAELNDLIQELYVNPSKYEDVISFAAEKGGNYGELASELAGIIMSDYVTQSASLAYSYTVPSSLPSSMRPGSGETVVSTTYTGNVRKVHEGLMSIGKVMPKDSSSERKKYRKYMDAGQKKIIDFSHKNSNATKEEWEEFGRELLRDPAFELVSKVLAPQVSKQRAAKDYTIGETAIVDGITWKKTGEGAWEEQ
jgi:hypothetical protein